MYTELLPFKAHGENPSEKKKEPENRYRIDSEETPTVNPSRVSGARWYLDLLITKKYRLNFRMIFTFVVEMYHRATIVCRDVALVNCTASVHSDLGCFGFRCAHDRPVTKIQIHVWNPINSELIRSLMLTGHRSIFIIASLRRDDDANVFPRLRSVVTSYFEQWRKSK